MNRSPTTLVIGLGNPLRGDDAIGGVIARRLRELALPDVDVREESGEGVALLEAWQNATNVILIDAAQSGAAPGTIHRLDASRAPVSLRFFPPSTHAFGVAEAVELARALNQLPGCVVLYGIEGRSFRRGETLSPEVAGTVDEVLKGVCGDLGAVTAFSASMR
jgi:hydrogenase maturation protease